MRDGIPKTIPVPRKWQRYIESADRKADRGTQRVVRCLADAVLDTFIKLFPGEQRKLLVAIANDPQTSLPGFEVRLPSPTGPGTHNLAQLLDDVRRDLREGKGVRTALIDALAAKMESSVAAFNRLISEDLATKCRPQELTRVRAEMSRVASLFNAREEASSMLSESSSKKKPAAINADEDLRS